MRGQTVATRTFWWDRTSDADVDPLRAVIFDLDAVIDTDDAGDPAAPDGLLDLVMSLFVAGVWVAVVSTGRRTDVEPLVRELFGDGLVETIVTADDVTGFDPSTEVYELAMWELGAGPESCLAMVGSGAALRITSSVGLAAVVVASEYSAFDDFTTAVSERSSYDALMAADCQRLHRLWYAKQKRFAAA
ncbi:MAG TPA: HAD family hydrolase [Mycobacterium sp.]|jgi:beta-phosphoglucomutase-like phosphatase (HAD superfamily)